MRPAAVAALLLLLGCSGRPAAIPVQPAVRAAGVGARAFLGVQRGATTPIEHVVFIRQENRSFDNLFQAYPGADTVAFGKTSQGQILALEPIPLTENYDMDNSAVGFFAACDGEPRGRNCKMDGFDRESVYFSHRNYTHPQYGYVPHAQSRPYFDIAHQYVLADRMFTSQIDGSFVSHQYAIAAYASRAVNFPRSAWHCGGGSNDDIPTLTPRRTYGPRIPVCFDNPTLGDELDAAGLSWRFYAARLESTGGLWSAYGAISHVRYGQDWQNVVTPNTRFLTDVASGTLANVTWITPTWITSDHPSSRSARGPAWVTSLVNAIGNSKFWNTTAIFIMWDDWGGWYDHVPPPYVDYDGLGVRVPLLIVSSYAKKGYVTHVQYEQGSVLRFIEDNWGLPQLAASDARANDPANDAFDWSMAPRPFRPFRPSVPASYFANGDDAQEPEAQ